MVDTSQRLQHTIEFRDPESPRSKAKPEAAMGAGTWMKLDDPAPTGAADVSFVAVKTRTPYTLDFAGADAGKRVYYILP